ncbi:MAG: sodium:solute symporter family protein [Candidatus Babeliales bacterium]
MNMMMFIGLFIGLGVGYLILGLIFSRGIKNLQDYFLAGRKLGVCRLTATLIGTQIGGGLVLGTSAESYKYGIYGILYSLGICLGFLLLGCGFAYKLRAFEVATVAEIFEVFYGSKILKKVASLISAISLCGILAAQVLALKSLFCGLGLNSYLIIITWAFLIIYTMIGGLKAVIASDFFQIFVILSVFTGVFLYSFNLNNFSILDFKNIVLDENLFNFSDLKFNAIFATLIVPILFALIEQDLAQKFFAAKTKLVAAISAFMALIVVLLFSFIPVYFGTMAKYSGLNVNSDSSPLVVFISNNFNSFILALVLCAIGAAITSTSTSLLTAISSNLSQDFDFNILKNKLLQSKVITFFVGVIALILGLTSKNIIETLIISYDFMLSALFIPLFFVFFKKSFTKESAILSIIFGSFSFMILKIYPLNFPTEIITLSISLVGYILGSFFKKIK